MTTTTINKLYGATDLSVTLPIIDPADWRFSDQKTDKAKGANEGFYRLTAAGASVAYPTDIRTGIYINPAANGGVGQVNVSVRLQEYSQVDRADSTSVILPGSWVLSKTQPGLEPFPDKEADFRAIGILIGSLIHFVAGVPSSTHMDDLQFGIMSALLTHEQAEA
jgi:hypothetical protein